MIESLKPQTTDINGKLQKIFMPDNRPRHENAQIDYFQLPDFNDVAQSPPLSDLEISDLHDSYREYESRSRQVFDDVNEFFTDLDSQRTQE
jgi:hypothetical protein